MVAVVAVEELSVGTMPFEGGREPLAAGYGEGGTELRSGAIAA